MIGKRMIGKRGTALMIGILLFTGLFVALPNIVQAQEQGLVQCGGRTIAPLTTPIPDGWTKISDTQMAKAQPACDFCHLFALLSTILNFIFFTIVPPLAVVLIMIGGFFFFLSAGDPAKQQKGKDVLSAVVVGIILTYGAWIFINTLLAGMGVAEWTGLKSWWKIDCELGELQYTAPASVELPASPISARENFQYYCQADPKWKDVCELGASGCGPTSLAMVLASFGARCDGQLCTPPQVDAIFLSKGWRTCDSGSNMTTALTSDWLTKSGSGKLNFESRPILGVNYLPEKDLRDGSNWITPTQAQINLMKEYLDNGYLIIASSQWYTCRGNCSQARIDSGEGINHIIVIDGINNVSGSSPTISVRDSNNCSSRDGKEIAGNRTQFIDSFPWYYAFALKPRQH
ncbi:MAG: C39 family peptidase [bacterium]|nr:C39 family peptidase [bacterium]